MCAAIVHEEVYADLFTTELSAMEKIPELAAGLTALETELMTLLNLDQETFHVTELLSLACLPPEYCKKRSQTAKTILGELLQRLPTLSVAKSQEGAV